MQQDSNNGGMTQYFPEPQSQRPLVENPENFSDPLVQMSEVTVRYSDGASVWTPLNNASVMIGPDRVTALLMPTTTDAVVVAQAMMGMIPLASGEVRILGRNVSTMGIKRLARLHSQDVATIMPESELAPTFTVEANIQAHFRMTGRAVDPAWLARVLEMAGIAEHRGTKYGLLDPCTQRLVDCAVALLQGPRVAIAAEPTAQKSFHFAFSAAETTYLCHHSEGSWIEREAKEWDFPITYIEESDIAGLTKIHQFSLGFPEPEQSNACAEVLNAKLGDLIHAFPNACSLDITPAGISKDQGIRTLLSVMGWDGAEVFAIGDETNDLPMLKAAGKSVAMGNAFPEVKEEADYETLSCTENGLAAAIYTYVLGMGANAPVPIRRG
mgnify:CR=1 FL=1